MSDRRRAVSSMDVLPASPLMSDRRRASEYHGCTPARPNRDAIGCNLCIRDHQAGRPGDGLESPGARVQGVRADTSGHDGPKSRRPWMAESDLPVGCRGTGKPLPSKAT